jgi:hypothetical protein
MRKEMKSVRPLPVLAALAIFACAFVLALLVRPVAGTAAAPVATPAAMPSGEDLLSRIRAQFRSHRPPPMYETYTLVRTQNTNYGYPDYVNSYTWHVWYRSPDHAALGRKESKLGSHGQLTFKRPMFNVADDPGPPTADVFEPAPAHTLPPDFVPTPEASPGLSVIATVRVKGEFDYRVTNQQREGDLLHVSLSPRRDPDRNRLRELWVDAKTLELKKIVATDKLFVEHGPIYPVIFTINFSTLEGVPIITNIHGVVGGSYDGDGQIVDFDFKDIAFPKALPDWYFDAHSYASHAGDAPL